ncbi:SDR family oxidoreductase [Nocardia araoensis]|uniref:SDR family oxidoreductase n=1 Tax=Nocardia araoensis TaxID=228600 RepID=UPI0002E9351E|nr:SDR family oxidoreductase [Nocardia araoensis]
MLLITGANGLNGRAMVKEFARRGQAVRVLVRNAGRIGDLGKLAGVEVVEGDLLRPQTLAPALEGVERAMLISSADATMVEAQCTFIDAARTKGVKHIIKFSGLESGIGFDPDNFRFTRNHKQIERYLEASGVAWTHLQPSQFMQVYLREARSIAAHGELALPTGQIRLSPVDIRDIAQVAFHLLTTDGHEQRSYPMTGPQALTMSEIAATIAQTTGKQVAYVGITPEERREAMLAAGVPGSLAEDLYDQAVERLKHPESRVSLETHQAFGVRPTTFADFAAHHAADFTGSR